MDPRQTIDALYAAFGRLDAQGMTACYADDARFDDEVFSLHGRREVAAMWGILGWTPLLRRRVRDQASANLRRHRARSAA